MPLFNTKTLALGDTAYYATSGRWGNPGSTGEGKVIKISASGQITIETPGTGTMYHARFTPRGNQIGGNRYLITHDEYENRVVRIAIDKGKRDLRYKLAALGNLSVNNKQDVLQALREVLAFAEINLVEDEA